MGWEVLVTGPECVLEGRATGDVAPTEITSLGLLLCPAGVQAHPEKPLEPLLTVSQIFSSAGSGSALFLPAFWATR